MSVTFDTASLRVQRYELFRKSNYFYWQNLSKICIFRIIPCTLQFRISFLMYEGAFSGKRSGWWVSRVFLRNRCCLTSRVSYNYAIVPPLTESCAWKSRFFSAGILQTGSDMGLVLSGLYCLKHLLNGSEAGISGYRVIMKMQKALLQGKERLCP